MLSLNQCRRGKGEPALNIVYKSLIFERIDSNQRAHYNEESDRPVGRSDYFDRRAKRKEERNVIED